MRVTRRGGNRLVRCKSCGCLRNRLKVRCYQIAVVMTTDASPMRSQTPTLNLKKMTPNERILYFHNVKKLFLTELLPQWDPRRLVSVQVTKDAAGKKM